MKKKLLAGFGLLLLAGVLVLALRPAAVPVTPAEVVSDSFTETVEEEGRTRLRETWQITAPVDGWLRRVALEPGDPVTRGDPLFRMEGRPAPALDARGREQAREQLSAAESRLASARSELEARETERELAETEYERSHRLHERDMISSEERDRRRSRMVAARAAERSAGHAVETARFERNMARANLEVADGERAPDDAPVLAVPSPLSGVIVRRHRESEGPVAAGEAVLEVGDMDLLEVEVDLLTVEAVRLEPGMPVVIERWGGGEDLEGRVRRVEPGGFERVSALGVDEQRVPVRVEITSPRQDWDRLGEDFRVEARFIVWEGEDVTQVPAGAVFRSGDQEAVYVIEEGRAQLRPVNTGRRSGLWVQVRDGLEPGETVIRNPGDRVTDGARVRPD